MKKHILITGANSGIGLKAFEKSIKKGYLAIAAVRDPNSMSEVIKHKNLKEEDHLIAKLDMRDEDSIYGLITKLKKERITIDYAVLNAGFIKTAPSLMTTKENINDHLLVNYTNQVLLAQLIVKSFFLKKKAGSLVAISSSAAIDANPGRLAYAASKSALSTAIRVMSKEFGKLNIRCNIVAPGLTDTGLMHDSTQKEEIEKFINSISINRIGLPEEIADLILFLCSENSKYLTGQVISCDGGIR